MSDDLGLPIVGMTPYTTAINALDKGEWRAAVDEFRGAIEIAQVVGADRLRVYAGSWQPDQPDHAGALEPAGRGPAHTGPGSLRRRDTAVRGEPFRHHDPDSGRYGPAGA